MEALLNYISKKAVKFTSKDESREYLHKVYVTTSHTYATDGHRMIKIKHPFTIETPKSSALEEVALDREFLNNIKTDKVDRFLLQANPETKEVTLSKAGEKYVSKIPENLGMDTRKMELVMTRGKPAYTAGFDLKLLADTFKTLAECMRKEESFVDLAFHPNGALVIEFKNMEQEIYSCVMSAGGKVKTGKYDDTLEALKKLKDLADPRVDAILKEYEL